MRGNCTPQLIAVVDDEAALRQAIRSLLRSAGFNAQCFASAAELLRADSVKRAACLILDVHLPGMSGLELQQLLVAQGARIPVIFITGQDDANGSLQARALQAGAVAFLRKPFLEEDLLHALQQVLPPSTE
jgi:FixJ family two-component response regulator